MGVTRRRGAASSFIYTSVSELCDEPYGHAKSAQLARRRTLDHEVRGSIPAKGSNLREGRSQARERPADPKDTPPPRDRQSISPGGTEFVTWLPADPAVDLRNPLEARGVPDRGAADWVQEEQLLSPW